ncbi:YciI family protein [Pseudoduganella chitinolytica]|uniref:YciI family protein n=1 Tax=Pseudoduganella chitinolytica TaxID=34070 RepID=UPI003530CAC2
MNAHNAAAIQAGVALAGEGLRATAQGTRVRFRKGADRPAVIDGPFTEIKELIAGYWLIQAATRQQAIEWVKAYPFPCWPDLTVELRELALPGRA